MPKLVLVAVAAVVVVVDVVVGVVDVVVDVVVGVLDVTATAPLSVTEASLMSFVIYDVDEVAAGEVLLSVAALVVAMTATIAVARRSTVLLLPVALRPVKVLSVFICSPR